MAEKSLKFGIITEIDKKFQYIELKSHDGVSKYYIQDDLLDAQSSKSIKEQFYAIVPLSLENEYVQVNLDENGKFVDVQRPRKRRKESNFSQLIESHEELNEISLKSSNRKPSMLLKRSLKNTLNVSDEVAAPESQESSFQEVVEQKTFKKPMMKKFSLRPSQNLINRDDLIEDPSQEAVDLEEDLDSVAAIDEHTEKLLEATELKNEFSEDHGPYYDPSLFDVEGLDISEVNRLTVDVVDDQILNDDLNELLNNTEKFEDYLNSLEIEEYFEAKLSFVDELFDCELSELSEELIDAQTLQKDAEEVMQRLKDSQKSQQSSSVEQISKNTRISESSKTLTRDEMNDIMYAEPQESQEDSVEEAQLIQLSAHELIEVRKFCIDKALTARFFSTKPQDIVWLCEQFEQFLLKQPC